MYVPRDDFKNRAHSLAKHLHLLIQIDDIKFNRDVGSTGFNAKVKPRSIIVLKLCPVAIVLRPQIELVVRRVIGHRALARFTFHLVSI